MPSRPARAAAALLALAVPSIPAPAQAPAGPAATTPPPTLHLRGGRWFDGTRFRPMNWYVVGGRLTARRPERVDAVVDLSGRWVVPPLAEAHNHDLQNAWSAARNAAAYTARGVFYSGQLAATPADVAAFRGFLNGPATPDTLFSDALITSGDGHPLGMALAGAKAAGMELRPEDLRNKAFWTLDTRADLDARWGRIAAGKPALVKLVLIDAANHAANRADPKLFGYNGLDPALAPEIVRRSHAAGARVAAHVDTGADFAAAVAAGVDIVAHLPGYRIAAGKTQADYRIPDAAVAEAARRRVAVMTTTAASRYAVRARPEQAAAIRASYGDNLRRLRAAGVPLMLGSDAYEGSVLDEVDGLDALGVMPRAELLRAAVEATPRLLFPRRDVGRFAEGAEASLLALPADPLADLSALRRPALMVKRGTLLGALP